MFNWHPNSHEEERFRQKSEDLRNKKEHKESKSRKTEFHSEKWQPTEAERNEYHGFQDSMRNNKDYSLPKHHVQQRVENQWNEHDQR